MVRQAPVRQCPGGARRRSEVPRRPIDINVDSTEKQLRKVLLAKSGEDVLDKLVGDHLARGLDSDSSVEGAPKAHRPDTEEVATARGSSVNLDSGASGGGSSASDCVADIMSSDVGSAHGSSVPVQSSPLAPKRNEAREQVREPRGVDSERTAAFLSAGGSVAAGRRPASGVSRASMIVHHTIDEPTMNMKERVHAYLTRSVPELEAHIHEKISSCKEQVRRRADEELAERFLVCADRRKVFDRQANDLRWQNARRKELGRRMKGNMVNWILDAIEGWDERKAMEGQVEETGDDSQVIQEYVTKRAAHIDSGKLPTEIPIFKTLRSSYSLPSMWRDKYL